LRCSGASGCLLVIACANVAGLLITRTLGRSNELSIRIAIGAGKGRIVRQFLTENLLLTVLGGMAGIAVAYAGFHLLTSLIPEAMREYTAVGWSWKTALLLTAVCTSAGLMSGMLPAWRATRINTAGARVTATSARGLFIVAEVALTIALLAGASLMFQTFLRLRTLPSGFRSENVLTMDTVLPSSYGTRRGASLSTMKWCGVCGRCRA
jgi:putative ABC transport system permease protein